MRDPISDAVLDRCIRACEEAERACTRALARALERGGLHADPERLRLLLECSRTCARSAQVLRRGWWDHAPFCAECAELCEVCAKDCRGFDDPELRACAEACLRCAEACRCAAERRVASVMLDADGESGDAA